jgi:hypothetical protein
MNKLIGIPMLALGILALAGVCRADDHDHDRDHGHRHGHHFSNRSLRGTYVTKFQGTNSGGDGTLEGKSLAPVNGVGQLIADGEGHFTGTQTTNILFNTDGTPTSSGSCPGPFGVCTAICTTTLKGTYTINPDGTGTTSADATPTGTDPRCGPKGGFDTTSYIILQSSNHLVFVGTDFDATIGGQATRQERDDDD